MMTDMAKYNKDIVGRICQLISSDSYTTSEICKIVGIADATFYEWKQTKAEFSDSVKKAADKFNELIVTEAKKSLVKKIRGYVVQEKKTVTVDTGKKDNEGKPIVRVKEHVILDKYFQPDTAAIIFALTNRDSANWKNHINNEVTGKDGESLFQGVIIQKSYDKDSEI
jgi:transposase-like protein